MLKIQFLPACLFVTMIHLTACDNSSSTTGADGNQEGASSSTSLQSGELDQKSSSSVSSVHTSSETALSSSGETSSASEDDNGERIVCRGYYSNLPIKEPFGTTFYPEAFRCDDGNSCGRSYTSACSETECYSVLRYTCNDGTWVEEEDFFKRYRIEMCKGNYCSVLCYNNEIALDDGDSLNVIECDDGFTYLRDGAMDRVLAGKAIPDSIKKPHLLGSTFATNCKYGKEYCAQKVEPGEQCHFLGTTIECPYKNP